MSLRYKGGRISATPPTTTGGESGVASGSWTLEQQFQAQGAGNWPTPVTGPWIEDCFSTYLYTGNGSTQTITNGIDLAGKGGMVWLKCRNSAENNEVYDTVRGANQRLITNTTGAQVDRASSMAFSSTGLSWVGDNISNTNGNTYASWTFRKQPKFFDVQTFTSNSSNGGTFTHNLGDVPGCLIVKSTGGTDAWLVWHRGLTGGLTTNLVLLNTTGAQFNSGVSLTATSTSITIPNGILANASSGYVAYLFAHDAGGFGLTGTENVISCGSFSGNTTVTLGYEPQWILLKRTSGAERWYIIDNMRGWPVSGDANYLAPNTSDAESQTNQIYPNATGFSTLTGSGDFIYIAIRRGPMKVPTSGTSVFAPTTYTSNNTNNRLITTGILTDAVFARYRNAVTSTGVTVGNRLTGDNFLGTALTSAEFTSANGFSTPTAGYGNGFSAMNGFGVGINASALLNYGTIYNAIAYSMQRAPSFFDVVCYTGTGSARTVSHNLGVAPEMMIVKNRSITSDWRAYSANLGATENLKPNTTDAASSSTLIWNDTAPTSSVFSVGTAAGVNGSGNNMVAYLFATCAGVSKVGSYTGTATTLQVDCGFTAGARFVLIKRTDSTGDWYVWDSARGIVAGNDPYLLLNSTAAEVTNTDYVDTYSAGFEISSTAPAAINASGGTFIFLAIA